MNLIDIYKTLRKNSKRKVTMYRSDWAIDRRALRGMASQYTRRETTTMEFVHVSTDTGTHLFPVYADRLDISRPYLFGDCTPRETLNSLASMFSNNSQTIQEGSVIQHFDNVRLRVIDKAAAQRIFNDAANFSKSQSRVA